MGIDGSPERNCESDSRRQLVDQIRSAAGHGSRHHARCLIRRLWDRTRHRLGGWRLCHTGGKDMTATKIGRGFHQLALLLAALPLLIGGSLSVYIAFDLANRLWEQHQTLVCAHQHIAAQKPGENVFDQFNTVKLKQIGCSNSDDTVTVGEARNPPPNLNWFAEFGSALLLSPLPQ